MGIRERSGNWHYRFEVHGHEYTGDTGLAATKRNESAARMKEAEARRKVKDGRAEDLRLIIKPFSEAAGMFLDWAKGEHRDHPATAKRLETSFVSLRKFFQGRSVVQITAGDLEDFKTWRRSIKVKEVTIRHDLHALSKFYGYAIRHHWAAHSPVDGVEIPSDKDAVRIHVLTEKEEAAYFGAIGAKAAGVGLKETVGAAGQRKIAERQYSALADAARVMLLTGARPEEVMKARAEDVQGDWWQIVKGKTPAARRRLRLIGEAKSIMTRRAGAGGWLWPGKAPGSHVATFQRTHEAALEHAGLCFVVYDLRHTFATRAAAAGMPVTTLAAVLGHNNLRSVMKYVHVRQADIEAGMKLMEAVKVYREESAVVEGRLM